MKELQIYQIDSFAKRAFEGNPAAVCYLESWLDDDVLLKIAQENNLAETAFFVSTENGYHIRWFTPKYEVPLCGHGTLAAAFVIFTEIDTKLQSIQFESKSGILKVAKEGDMLVMDFPAFEMKAVQSPPEALTKCLKVQPQEVFIIEEDPNYHVILKTESEVRAINPDFNLMEKIHPFGVVITAPGDQSDIVSRCFAPSYGIPEDPVTGSIHSALVPYWANRLGKSKIHAYQASERGGDLYCEFTGERVLIGGYAVKYLTGKIQF